MGNSSSEGNGYSLALILLILGASGTLLLGFGSLLVAVSDKGVTIFDAAAMVLFVASVVQFALILLLLHRK